MLPGELEESEKEAAKRSAASDKAANETAAPDKGAAAADAAEPRAVAAANRGIGDASRIAQMAKAGSQSPVDVSEVFGPTLGINCVKISRLADVGSLLMPQS